MTESLVWTLLEGDEKKRPRTIRWATVAQTSPLTVTFPGDSEAVAVSRLKSYTPTLDEQAVILQVGARWVAIGGIA